MTPKEFKERYPEYNHLNGNELWNKMEDILFQQKEYNIVNEVKDWMGNILKEGDQFCIIRVINRQTMRFAGVVYLDSDKPMDTTNAEPIRPDQPCWEPGEYHTVEHNRYRSIYNGYIIDQSLSMLNFDLHGIDTHILAIKGISDKKELYYANSSRL